MKNTASVVFGAAEQFEKMAVALFANKKAQDMSASAQAADVKAVVAPALGLVKDGADYKFDVNSKPADIIFNAMYDKNFTGSINITLIADKNKKASLQITANPANAASKQAIAIISTKLTPNINAALAKLKMPIADTITIEDIVTAQNQ